MQETIWKILLLIQPLVGSMISRLFGGSKTSPLWYKNLNQSPLTPPGVVFPIVWSVLYVLLGINGYFIYNKLSKLNRPEFFKKEFLLDYFPAYEIQLLLNFSWSFFFFAFQKPVISLIIVSLMVIFTAYLLWKSWLIDKSAFYVLVPYFLWISFATYLNFYIVLKN